MRLYKLIEKKRKEKRNKMVKRTAVSTLIGGAVGVLSGLLLAPKSGKETRKDIQEKVGEIKNSTVEKKNMIKSNVNEAKEKIKNYLKEKNKKEELDKDMDLVLNDEEGKNGEIE